jgi:hypothetical protein
MKKVEILFNLMQSGKPVPVESMMKTLNVKQGSIMCLISALRNDLGAEIETVRDGRKVLTYQLMNADKVKIPAKIVRVGKVAKPKAAKTAKAAKVSVVKTKTKVNKPSKTVVDDEVPTLEIQEIDSDAELASLKAELGLSESYAE